MKKDINIVKAKSENYQEYRVILYGLGDIGIGTGKLVLERSNLRIIGAIDIDESKTGKDLYKLMNIKGESGIKVKKSLADVLSENTKPHIVLHTAGSYLRIIYPQLKEIVSAGINVVSSSEELLYPYLRNPDLALELDKLAKSKGVTVLGTGVNPGFVMDSLPIVLSGVCQRISKIEVIRVVDVSTRRKALQKKVGAGLTIEEFKSKLAEGKFGHVGLAESLALLASSIGWELDTLEESIGPAIAKNDMPDIEIKKGQVTGIKQVALGLKGNKELLRLDLEISAGAENPRDYIIIHGTPTMELEISGGTSGDLATAAALVNVIPQVVDAHPGLVAMGRDIFPRYNPSVKVNMSFDNN